VRDSAVVKFSRDTFDALVRLNPQIMTEMTKRIFARQQRLFAQDKPQLPAALSTALVPASPAVDISSFAAELAHAMARYGTTRALNAAQFDTQFGKADAAQTQPDDGLDALMSSWLDDFESNQAFVLYAADASLTAWTRRCLGRADRVLLVGRSDQDATPGETEQAVAAFEIPVRTELVLLHPPDTERPSGTARWLNQRERLPHHHVRQGNKRHVARLARRLTDDHQYDIDLIIRKTLEYAVLSGLLVLIYFGVVILLQRISETVSGQQSPIAIVVSTLVIAALFNPLRQRVQSMIDRRFTSKKYDAQQVLAQFTQTARDEVSLDVLTAELLHVVEETIQPETATLWLKDTVDTPHQRPSSPN
jgi:hypothetical protein